MSRPPKITNEEILAAAREVFLEHGVSASTLAIAEKAGISEASIFKRFATKQALFLAAIGISETPKWVKVLSSHTPSAEIRTELTQICIQILEFYQEVMPRVFMLMTQGSLPVPPNLPILPPPIRDSQLLAGYLDRAIAQGYLKPCDSTTLGHMIVGAINNYVITQTIAAKIPLPVSFFVPKFKSIEPTTFIRNLIETLWAGIDPDR
jgi:AcrR family transcriptional regulator